MRNSITRNLHQYFCKLMSCSSSPMTAPNKTNNPNSAPSSPPSPSSPVVYKNFNSLYDPAAAAVDSDSDNPDASHSATFTATTATATATGAATDSDDSITTDTDSLAGDPDLSSAIASRRLLPPSSPSWSNAIADPSAVAVGIGVAVPTYSPDPYGDFRRSMEEMAAAMGLLGPRGPDLRRRTEKLYELLLCYLALNRKHAHKYIVGAFADFLVGIAEAQEVEEEEAEEVAVVVAEEAEEEKWIGR